MLGRTTPVSFPSATGDPTTAPVVQPVAKPDSDTAVVAPVEAVQGPQGVPGPKGDTGAKGDQGIQGVKGDQGVPGAKGDTGAAGVNNFGPPVTRTINIGTAYQASTPSKPAVVTLNVQAQAGINILGFACSGKVIVGPANTVSASTGMTVAQFKHTFLPSQNGLTGVQVTPIVFALPANYYFAFIQTEGTAITVLSAFDQAVG